MKILLTGSSKGIGFNIANTLINEGHDIALHYNKNKSSLNNLIKDSKTNFPEVCWVRPLPGHH